MTQVTTATGGSADDEDIVTMEVVDEPKKARWLSPERARAIFLGLAGIAGLALVAAIVVIVLAPSSALTWLVVALVVLAIVVVAEIVLLVLARPRTP